MPTTPGASTPLKRWAPDRFAQVGDALANAGWRVAITGSGAERPIADAVAHRMRHPAVIAACDISIGGLAAFISRSALLVSNDTGVAHLAGALNLPSVVIFFATDPLRWAPLNTMRNRHISDPQGVEVDGVITHVFDLLQNVAVAR